MVDETRAVEQGADGFVPFHSAGTRVRGSFRCAQCTYGVSVSGVLPPCPMCAGTSWEAELRPVYARYADPLELGRR